MSEENILLWAEQGIGDEIFFAGMLPQALDRFSKYQASSRLKTSPNFKPILSDGHSS